MFKTRFSKKTLLTVVNNNELYIIEFDKHGNENLFHSMPLDQFLTEDPVTAIISEDLKDKTNALLILPDYWSGNTSYLFQSKRSALAKAFIERKLIAEHPNIPDIKHFFDFSFSQADPEHREVYVFFLHEPKAFQLYHKLSKYNLSPARISTPALLWEQKLVRTIPDIDIGGTCFAHLLSSECFLYFFSNGRFIFSRHIGFPDVQETPDKNSEVLSLESDENTEALSLESDENTEALSLESPDKFNILTYEINQSLYLFSQKTKSEMGKIYLLSSNQDSGRILSDSLGREVIDLGTVTPNLKGLQESPGIPEYLGPVGPFNIVDLSPSKLYLNLTHSALKKILEWKPIQTVGMFLGLALLLLLVMESFFLLSWSRVNRDQMAQSRSMSGAKQQQIVQQYSQALDLIIAEIDRPSPRKTIIKIGKSLPDNVWITEMDMETEMNPAVVINGVVKATGADQLKNTFSTFLNNLNLHFEGTRTLSIQDIDFKLDKNRTQQEYNTFLFTFKFNLP